MYKEKWVQDLIEELKDFVASNHTWLGLDANRPQRVLDYACGNGTISEVSTHAGLTKSSVNVRSQGLALVCPKTIFRGIDILPAQVNRFSNAAIELLGDDSDRMSAVEGDLYDPSSTLQTSDWHEFDMAITSMALHRKSDEDNPYIRHAVIMTYILLRGQISPTPSTCSGASPNESS